MSCYIMDHDAIRTMGYTLADCLNRSIYGNEYSIAVCAAEYSNLGKAFMDGFCFMDGRFQPEGISITLHRLNAQAYAERYRESELEMFSTPKSNCSYSLWRPPEYGDHHERPQGWHYTLLALTDCWLYQTAEGDVYKSDTRHALDQFAQTLARLVAQHSPSYISARQSF